MTTDSGEHALRHLERHDDSAKAIHAATWLRRHACSVATVVAALATDTSSLAAQAGVTIRGHVTWGAEVSVLRPCGSAVEYWLEVPAEIRPMFIERYDQLQREPYDRVYVELGGWTGTGPTDGFASEYDGSWRLTRLDTMRRPTAGDCASVPPPVWLEPERVDCESSVTVAMVDCFTVRLAEADRRLNRYSTAALDFAADREGLYRAQYAWEQYRDIHCAAAAEEFTGGSIQPVEHLGCRLGLSEARLLEIWNAYLRGRTTDLPDPRP